MHIRKVYNAAMRLLNGFMYRVDENRTKRNHFKIGDQLSNKIIKTNQEIHELVDKL
jgi:hypothetical protein